MESDAILAVWAVAKIGGMLHEFLTSAQLRDYLSEGPGAHEAKLRLQFAVPKHRDPPVPVLAHLDEFIARWQQHEAGRGESEDEWEGYNGQGINGEGRAPSWPCPSIAI